MFNRRLAGLVLLTSFMGIACAAKPAVAQVPTDPLVTVIDFYIDSVTAEGDQLIANAVAVLDVSGREVTQNVQIPIDLSGSYPDEDGDGQPDVNEDACPILHLSLGPVNLDLLGLVVYLDNCEGGPVVVDIDALAGEGLLGDLLCGVAGLLDGGLNLGEILDGLTDEQLLDLTDTIGLVLNQVLGGLLSNTSDGEMVAMSNHQSMNQNGRCDILNLHLPDGLSLNLLGLAVDTSGICLDVYAQQGGGNLLGNLLCSLTNLLNNPGNNGNAPAALLRNINRTLDRLGL